jgi:hypothetical protein
VVCLRHREGDNLSRRIRMVNGIGQVGMTFLAADTHHPPPT